MMYGSREYADRNNPVRAAIALLAGLVQHRKTTKYHGF